eukprot:CAMPEP_0203664426 /NCGR_PEP_ID=MMETSP0090-20130426/1834_1 /ASSEMBLY_ACC=CAM_ASM_001088 /TAXON_ID=426623 /ORGANISM="Chaetoceros affinis, Strain CCMP159" /LENGTH=404 /DNA_ID=CAMNT_0050527655 /DNA_START=76 /DNA_END=1290 /DNA_ORIENTATION=+
MNSFRLSLRFLLLLSLLAIKALGVTATSFLRTRPVVGVLSQPAFKSYHADNFDYIAASYVKWLESAGARAIVIPYGANDSLIKEIFTQINGVLFPGGATSLPKGAETIWKLILERNADEDDYFPVWGTCLGFEFLVMLVGGGEGVLQNGFDSENITLPLIFPSKEDVLRSNGVYSLDSALYPPSTPMRETLVKVNITMNNHHQGITPSHFLQTPELTEFFHITSTNLDRQGRQFVSTIESKNYPIYGVQYHPEKNNFEYGLMDALQPDNDKYYSDEPYEVINHSEEAVELSMHLASFFVGKVRRSTYGNYNMTLRHPVVGQYTMIRGQGFEQIYLIPKAEHWDKKQNVEDYRVRFEYYAISFLLLCLVSSFVILRNRKFGLRFIEKHYFHIPNHPEAFEIISES